MALTKVTYGLLSADTSAIDLNIDANTLYVDSSANKVGIQTNSPSLALEVNDTSNVDGEQISIKGHANYGGTVVFRRGDSFNWRVGVGGGSSTNSTIPSSYFGFEQGNTASMVIAHTTGYVGIGTTSPDRQLELEGQGVLRLNATGSNTDPGIDFNTSSTNDMQFRYRGGSDTLAVYSYGTTSDVFNIKKATGYVGIGTSSPDTNLDITTAGAHGIILNQDTGNGAVSGRLFFKDSTRTNAILNVNGNLELRTGAGAGSGSGTRRLVVNGDGTITFNQAYTFPTADGSANQVLQTNGSGTLSFGTVSGTTINSNANNRVITGSGTANTLNGESNLVFDGTNLGIGTTSPGAALDIETAGNTQDGTYYSTVTINNTGSNTFSGVRFDRSGVAKWRVGLKNNDIFQISNLFTGGSSGSPNDECFNITNNSRVGIGTASPSELLEVNLGDIKVQGGANASTRGLIIAHTGQTGNLTMLRQDSSGSRGILETTERNLRISAGSAGGTGTAETLDFYVNGSQRMTIDTSGLVGIGANNPAQAFEVYRNSSSSSSGNYAAVSIRNDHSSGYMVLHFNEGQSQVWDLLVQNGVDALQFRRQGTETMRLAADGSVLVNTTVDSDNQIMRIRQGGSNADPVLSLDSDTGDQSYYRYMKFYRKGQTSSVAKLDIDWSGSSIGLAFTSDARLKTVTGEADGLELITRLNPVKYVWKSEPDRHGAQGFLAQEVEQAYYETGNSHARGVSRPVDGEEHYMLDDTTLIPNLVKAIKELKDENDALKARVEALES